MDRAHGVAVYSPIVYSEGGDDFSTIENRCQQVTESTATFNLVNSFDYYETFLNRLARLKNWRNVPVSEITKSGETTDVQFAMRHDVDAHPFAAIKCANVLKKLGFFGSFYILHTSHYYGQFLRNDTELNFVRHTGFKELFLQLLETGTEIGIHNDSLGVFLDHQGDGIFCLKEEIAFLRSLGGDIYGSAAHNSAVVYGAECFEIFRDHAVGNRGVVHWRNKSIDLQTIEMTDLGLTYEANHPILRPHLDLAKLQGLLDFPNDPLRNPEWQKKYFIDHPVFQRGYDYDVWLIGKDLWVVAGNGKCHFPFKLDELFEFLSTLPPKTSIVFSIHPIYVSG